MTSFYILRHGETETNVNAVFTGQHESFLTETGNKQAKICAETLENVHFDRIYSSSLIRAVKTAEYIAIPRGLDIITRDNLREIDAGLWEGHSVEQIKQLFAAERFVWENDFGNAVCNGGESVRELQSRIDGALQQIADECNGMTVCVVSHGAAIRSMQTLWRNEDLSKAKNHPWPLNTEIFKVRYTNGKGTIECD
ncbi:MAG: histidine phosphatase family protein [Clostridia bacterium]